MSRPFNRRQLTGPRAVYTRVQASLGLVSTPGAVLGIELRLGGSYFDAHLAGIQDQAGLGETS